MQTELFQCSPEAVPERESAGLRSGAELKAEGMKRAADTRAVVLDTARQTAKYLARYVVNGPITIDDVFRSWGKASVLASELGNASGSVFKEDCWEFVEWVPSKRPSNHGRPIRSWRLK